MKEGLEGGGAWRPEGREEHKNKNTRDEGGRHMAGLPLRNSESDRLWCQELQQLQERRVRNWGCPEQSMAPTRSVCLA
jgi:hypothetical protein